MKTLTIDQRVFKHQDTQTKIKIALFENDSRVSLDNDADYQFKIKNSSGYLKSEKLTIEDDRLVLTTDKLKDLPPDVYGFEIWGNEDSIYPSESYGYFEITKNVSEVDGKTIPVITIEDFEKRFADVEANNNKEIERKLSQISLAPEVFENADAIKQAYPNGKDGIFIAVDTGHQWYWVNGTWKDAGPYQDNTSIKDFVDNYLSESIAHKDSDGKFKLNLDNTLTSETMPTSAKRVGELLKFNFRNYSKTYSWYDFRGKVPIIELQGTLPTDASQKNSLSYKYENLEGTATLKWQGQSSLAFPKKNFTIKFDKKFIAKDGWLADNTYVLKGNFNDFSQSRNVVSAKIWAEIVKSRNWNYVPLADNDGSLIVDNTTNVFNVYEDIMPGLHGTGAVDGFPVMLVVNGDYCGLYSFVLKKKAETFGFGNSNLEYALSCERTPDNQNQNSVAFKGLADLDGKDFDFEYTKSDEDKANAKTSFNNMISKVIEATEENYESVIENYLDIDSVIDYMIFTSLISAADGITKNYLMLSYNGIKWYFSAYDLDSTFGNWQDGWLSQQPSGVPTLADWNRSNRAMHLVYTYGKDRLKARYKELRDGILSVENVRKMFIDYVSDISHALKDEELKLWPQTPASEVHNINQIVEHYRLRAEFIDKEIETL